MRIEYHRTLIADAARNSAFYAALKSVIVPGKSVVADIGAGTGLLGVMAAQLGAKEVFLFEAGAIASVAAETLKAAKVRNCHLIPCHSTEFEDALSCDVIVSETLGNYALEENIIDTLNDAEKRFLKPGGHMIPSAIRQWAAPVISSQWHDELTVWDRVGFDCDFRFARDMSLNNVYVRRVHSRDLLACGASAIMWDQLELRRGPSSNRKGRGQWTVDSGQTIYGFALWWDADLVPDIGLSTAPDAAPTHWEQLYFPLSSPLQLNAGDRLEVDLKSSSSELEGTHLAWTARHLDANGKVVKRVRHDLDKGYLP